MIIEDYLLDNDIPESVKCSDCGKIFNCKLTDKSDCRFPSTNCKFTGGMFYCLCGTCAKLKSKYRGGNINLCEEKVIRLPNNINPSYLDHNINDVFM